VQNHKGLKLILGGPGSGKTTKLLNIIEQEMSNGVAPHEISYVAFTRAAANEAAERAAAKFSLDPEADLPWFRTIHSLAYKKLAMGREEVLDKKDLRKFGSVVGEKISGDYDSDTVTFGGSKGDQMLRIVDYANTTMITLEQSWHILDEQVDWWELKRFDEAYSAYKTDVGKVDFTDLLLSYVQDGDPLGVKVAVIDEGQDLTAAQWAVVNHAFCNTERVYIGGDDDQAIYRWAGADVDSFLSLSAEPEVLPISFRLPREVFAFASKLVRRIGSRYSKSWNPSTHSGGVHWHNQIEGIDLTAEGSWLLIARNKYMLQHYERRVKEMGLNYRTRNSTAVNKEDVALIDLWNRARGAPEAPVTAKELRTLCKGLGMNPPALKELATYAPRDYLGWALRHTWDRALVSIPDGKRDFYLNCSDLTAEPNIRIETIHGVKGAEADNVVLLSDISYRTARGLDLDPDSEHRVFYVGATRARRNLHLVNPIGDAGYYPFPL
jgi:DNA helicase II / ATP-dependent DNA helicase PcrA